MSHVRVYYPETDEPFDVPRWKADELILKHGWRQTPIDKTGTPAVTDTLRNDEPEDHEDGPEEE